MPVGDGLRYRILKWALDQRVKNPCIFEMLFILDTIGKNFGRRSEYPVVWLILHF